MLEPTVSRPVCLGVKHPSEAKIIFLLLSYSFGFFDVGRPLWREDRSVFSIAAGHHQRSHSQDRVPRDLWPYLLSQIREFPNIEGQVPVFISLRIRVAQLYSQALGTLFFASYDSQGYSGGIRTRLHTGTRQLKVKVKVTLRLMVSQSENLGVEPHLGLMTRYLLLLDSYGLVLVGRSLWREDGSVFYICCWPSPA
jgi:hypothetical protein